MIPDNPAKPNQDSFIESQLAPKVWLFGVADGHGMHGHDVSGYIKTRYPRILASVLPIEDDVRIAIFRSVGQIAADLMS
jgi:serine/threonine protein phosphatase PrpC